MRQGSRMPGPQPGSSKKKEIQNAAAETATGSRLSPGGFRLRSRQGPLPAPGRAPPRRPVASTPTRDGPPGPALPGPRLLCRQREAATQRARTPSERPRLRVLPPGGGLMRAPAAPHRRPGREGAARARPASSAASRRPRRQMPRAGRAPVEPVPWERARQRSEEGGREERNAHTPGKS